MAIIQKSIRALRRRALLPERPRRASVRANGGLRHDALVGADRGLRYVGLCGAQCRSAGLDLTRGLDHEAAEFHHGKIAGAEPLACERSTIGPMVSHIAMSWFGMPLMPVKLPSFIALRSCR